jgi:hypothetical protein
VLRHLAARQPASKTASIFETGSVRGKKNKNLDIGLYWLISVFGPGQVSVVGLADNPPPEFAEDQPKKTRKPTGTYFLKFFKVRGHPKVAPHLRWRCAEADHNAHFYK